MAMLLVAARPRQARRVAVPALALAVVVLMPALPLPGVPGSARGDGIEPWSAELPSPRAASSVVWTDSEAYVFGGLGPDGPLGSILRVDPAKSEVETLLQPLLTPRWGTSAVWDGRYAYVFGGRTNPLPGYAILHGQDGLLQVEITNGPVTSSGALNEIVRFDPASPLPPLVVARLPTARWGTAAVFDGRYAYVFGGFQPTGLGDHLQEVVRFDPETGEVQRMEATLPAGGNGLSAVWTGSFVLLSGSYYLKNEYSYGRCGCLMTYDPAIDEAALVGSLPYWRTWSAMAWSGTHAYLFGGTGYATSEDILRFDPSAGALTQMSSHLPLPRYGMAAFWDGENARLLGGINVEPGPVSTFTSQILTYDTIPRLPTPPRSVSAQPGPGPGQVRLAWEVPAHADDLTDYRIYRAALGGEPVLLATVAPEVGTFTDAGLEAGSRWTYTVAAENEVGEGPAAGADARAPALPGPPRITAAEPVSLGRLRLSWSLSDLDTGGLPVRFRVFRVGEAGDETLLGETAPGAERYEDAGLAHGATYAYRLRAVNEVGEGPPGEVATGTTPTSPAEPTAPSAFPGTGRGEIRVSWSPPQQAWGAPVSYRVFGGDPGGSLALLADVGTARSFTETGLGDGTWRAYQVTAMNFLGESGASALVAARAPWAPSAPRKVTAEPGHGAGQVRVAWEAPADAGGGLQRYRVYRGPAAGGGAVELVAEVQTDMLSLVDAGLEPGARYRYRVSATSVAAEGPPSADALSSAQVVPRPQEDVAVVLMTDATQDSTITPEISNGGTVTFARASLLTARDPRDAGDWSEGTCFRYRADHGGSTMTFGSTYEVLFRYDALASVLRASTDGGATFRNCGGGSVIATPEWAEVGFRTGPYYGSGQAGRIRVWA